MGPGYGLRFGRRFLLCGHQVGFTIDNGLRSGTLPGPDVACRRVKTAEVNGIVIVGRRERDRRREAGRRRAGKSNLRVAGIVQYVVIAIPLADPDVGGKRIGGGDRSVVRFLVSIESACEATRISTRSAGGVSAVFFEQLADAARIITGIRIFFIFFFFLLKRFAVFTIIGATKRRCQHNPMRSHRLWPLPR